jgi:aspartate dehydrogenase
MNIGIIGCGAIGSTLAKAITEGKTGKNYLISICDIDKSRLEKLYDSLGVPSIVKTMDFNQLLSLKNIDLVIEVASQETVRNVAEKTLYSKKNILIMSIGVLSDTVLLNKLKTIAEKNNVKIYLPSGAICGLDGVKAASIENIFSVEITTTKNPRGLVGAPYLIENSISLENLKGIKPVFHGTARDASRGFPKNINVAVALDRTTVKIIADPNAKKTVHKIKVIGDFGELKTEVNNFTHPENPKTSYLAVLSTIRKLKSLSEVIQIGT